MDADQDRSYSDDDYNQSHEVDNDYETALADALGDNPRAAELSSMAATLRARREQLLRDLDTADDDGLRERVRRDLIKLDEQIAVLNEEAGITRFVEDAVRVSLEMRKLQD